MADSSAVGVSLTVIEDGEVGASAAWGWAVRGERPMTADTKIRAASLSKTAVGLCAMAMAEAGTPTPRPSPPSAPSWPTPPA